MERDNTLERELLVGKRVGHLFVIISASYITHSHGHCQECIHEKEQLVLLFARLSMKT